MARNTMTTKCRLAGLKNQKELVTELTTGRQQRSKPRKIIEEATENQQRMPPKKSRYRTRRSRGAITRSEEHEKRCGREERDTWQIFKAAPEKRNASCTPTSC
jgi:hypothetical protein